MGLFAVAADRWAGAMCRQYACQHEGQSPFRGKCRDRRTSASPMIAASVRYLDFGARGIAWTMRSPVGVSQSVHRLVATDAWKIHPTRMMFLRPGGMSVADESVIERLAPNAGRGAQIQKGRPRIAAVMNIINSPYQPCGKKAANLIESLPSSRPIRTRDRAPNSQPFERGVHT